MAIISFNYDYKNGELVKGSTLFDTKKLTIIGRVQRQIIDVIGRADRTPGLVGGSITFLIVQYMGNEYGNKDMTVQSLISVCRCPPPEECTDSLCLDGCALMLDNCCLTLN